MHIKPDPGKLQKCMKDRFWNLIVLIKTALSGPTWYPKSDMNISFCRVILKQVDDYNFSFKGFFLSNLNTKSDNSCIGNQSKSWLESKLDCHVTFTDTLPLFKGNFRENLKWILSWK